MHAASERMASWIGVFLVILSVGAAPALAGDPEEGSGAAASPSTAYNLMRESLLPGQPGGLSLPGADQAAAGQIPPQRWTGIPWFRGLHISGFLNQNTGMWVNPYGLKDWTHSRRTLAFSRTLGQIDANYRLDEDNSFFLRAWFVYEPPYGWADQSTVGREATVGNQFYNQYAVRDAWWKTKLGPLTVYTGNQIVVWGQSAAFRVGDVINPSDTTWGFGFANLEQSRMPLWMLHPILDLPDWGPLTNTFFEAVWIPGFQPMWWSNDYFDNRYEGEMAIAGRVSNGFSSGISHGGGRFDVHWDDIPYSGRDATLTTPAPYPGSVPPPFSREFYDCQGLSGMVTNGNPVPARRQHPCPAILAALRAGQPAVQLQPWSIPPVTWANMQFGFRLHAITPDGTELTALYYKTFDPYPTFVWKPYTPIWYEKFMPLQEMGITADRPVPVPASLGEYLPLIARFESVYTNHAPYMDFNPLNTSGVRYSDVVNNLVALDVDQAYAPWLTTTGNLTVNLELDDYITLDTSNQMFESAAITGNNGGPGGLINETVNKHDVFMLLNLVTSWWWDSVAPAWTMIYAPKGTTFLLFPSVTVNPPWTKNYFFKVQDVQVLSTDTHSFDGGAFKGENYVSFAFQCNFNLL